MATFDEIVTPRITPQELQYPLPGWASMIEADLMPGVIASGGGFYLAGTPPIAGVVASAGFVLNQIHCLPIWFYRRCFISDIAFNVTVVSGAGGVARAGIYESDPIDRLPSRLVFDGGEFAVDGATGIKQTSPTPHVPVRAGMFWAAMNFGVALATLQALDPAHVNPFMGQNAAGTQVAPGVKFAINYGPLPAFLPRAALQVTNFNAPAIYVRLASLP